MTVMPTFLYNDMGLWGQRRPNFFLLVTTIAAMLLFVGVGFSGFAVRWLSIYLTSNGYSYVLTFILKIASYAIFIVDILTFGALLAVSLLYWARG